MPKRSKRVLSFICCMILFAFLIPVPAVLADETEIGIAEADGAPTDMFAEADGAPTDMFAEADGAPTDMFAEADGAPTDMFAEADGAPTAMFGTPQLGSDDPLWDLTGEYPINRSTVPDDPKPHATGTVRILWDYDYIYARVVVEDSDVYEGPGADHTYDSIEFFVGPGSSGSNQWRVSATGVFSGQSHVGRAAWTQLTDTGYIVEMRIPKRDLILEPGKFTFEVNINNSTSKGGDRYEVVSAFGTPDSGYGGDASFRDSIELIPAAVEDTRHSVIIQAETGGKIEPNAPGNVLRVEHGASLTFKVTPDKGKIVDFVTVDDQPVIVGPDNTFTLTDIDANRRIHVAFMDDPDAEELPFMVWNDNFARGEYTTAVIIDLGEGREALGSGLGPELFTVSARNTTLTGDTVVFEGTRNIARVYANDEPKVRGYLGKVSNSPDYREGLDSGRYIVVELEFYTEAGGSTTLDGSSNSTLQNYNIILNGEIRLANGDSIHNAVFRQTDVVNPILDKFTTHTYETLHYALYIHRDESGDEARGLPLFIYTHGMSRGGTQAQIDQKASMRSANGSVALMKKIEENPGKYASHILNISYNDISTPETEHVKTVIDGLVEDGLVDPDRIYVAGFSWGGAYTNTLINDYPGFFAAAATLSPVFGSPGASADERHKDLAYWMFINQHNQGIYQTTLENFITIDLPAMTRARASHFESNEALTWPYNQYDQPSQRPDPKSSPPMQDYIAHEVEAAVLYNPITMDNPFTGKPWSIAPVAQSPGLPEWNDDYTDLFDWMFSQSRKGEIYYGPTAMYGTPELGADDPLWSKTEAYPINRSTVPDDPRPHATGTVRILWDENFIYARVEVQDSNLYRGAGGDHTYDSVEFFVGPGSSGSNQWRVSATGVLSGQAHTDRAAWTQITDTGYIVEIRVPKRDLTLRPGKFTFEVNINNSTEKGGDRYEVVSAFGTPDSGFGSDAAFRNSITLIPAAEPDPRLSLNIQAGMGGRVFPTAPGNVMRVVPGTVLTFTVIPDYGKIVDTVTVNGEEVTVKDDLTFTLTDIRADQTIRVTFKDDPAAEPLPFIVWNDNFARGEYTTALIIDLGEGRKADGSELHPGLFKVAARNTTLSGDTVVFEGARNITRVYANDEPKVRGYLGQVSHSPDYREGLDSGRYIVIELEFYTEVGGNTTLDGSNSTLQNYYIVQEDPIVLTEGDPIGYAVFKQTGVVNPILDKFTTHNYESLNYALYLHKDANGNVVRGLPLYVYTHGFSRGGTQAHIDQKASMKSANGSVALMKRMEENPGKYASHILNISYSGADAPRIEDVKKVIDDLIADGWADPDRIYVAGFSLGGFYTNNLVNTYPGFFAAAAPMGVAAGWPTADENKDLAYWIFVNAYDTRVGASNLDNFANDIAKLNNARASRFESNEALTWPYNQYDQPSQRPNPDSNPPLLDYIAHEVEAAVLYNRITMDNPFTGKTWSMAPIMQSPNLPAWNNDYTDVFDWMFSQRRPGAPFIPIVINPGGGDGGPGGEENTETGSSEPPYTLVTPEDRPAVTDEDGNTTLPGGGEIETRGGSRIQVPAGTTIDADGKVVIGSGGATVILDNGISLNIREGAELVLDEDAALGFTATSSLPFRDVSENAWFADYVNAAYTFGLFDGTSSASFSPQAPMTRAMFVQVLANLENVDRSGYTNTRFRDVADGKWYTAAIGWAVESGIVSGVSADRFDPDAPITREQMIVILFKYLQYKGVGIPQSQVPSFADAGEISSWALDAVRALQGIGIVTGKGDGLFDPKGTATRAEAAAVFVRLIEYLARL